MITMGKPTGFMEYKRENNLEIKPLERIKNFNEFHVPMSEEERSVQASRCMDCGVPSVRHDDWWYGKRLSVKQLNS
jgi:NAD-dependent SIR2 family protein deacetylase